MSIKAAERIISSPIGNLKLKATPRGLCSIEFSRQKENAGDASHILDDAEWQLQNYFSGKRQDFSLALDFQGTEFQKKVWLATSRIPFGRISSYSKLASGLKKPRAFRAVAQALNRNPLCVVVPCHRVIGKDGSLVGYAGGLEKKEFLISLERSVSSAVKPSGLIRRKIAGARASKLPNNQRRSASSV